MDRRGHEWWEEAVVQQAALRPSPVAHEGNGRRWAPPSWRKGAILPAPLPVRHY